MNRRQWKTVQTINKYLEKELNTLEAEGFNIHSVQAESHFATDPEDDHKNSLGMGVTAYTSWVIVAYKEIAP